MWLMTWQASSAKPYRVGTKCSAWSILSARSLTRFCTSCDTLNEGL